MSHRTEHELIVRGVLCCGGQVLLCRRRSQPRSFLPGGHIETGESAAGALRRELREELACEARIGGFLGCVEHSFRSGGMRVCEINLLFGFHVPGLTSAEAPASAEGHLAFFWHPLAQLEEVQFEPAVLRAVLAQWVAAPFAAALRFASVWPTDRP